MNVNNYSYNINVQLKVTTQEEHPTHHEERQKY